AQPVSAELLRSVVDKVLIRETLEKYCGSLDDKDWDGIASCFTDDAISHYNHEPEDLIGGRGVADWLHRMVAYNATDHSISNLRIELNGNKAFAHSYLIATLHQGDDGVGRVQVRGIDYKDTLVRVGDEWK